MKRLLSFIVRFGILTTGFSQEATRWRGDSGNGIYNETGLLKSWPLGGPEELWSFKELGKGHSSVAVSQGNLYTTGLFDETGVLFKFDLDGNLVWKKAYGPDFFASFPGTRGTPVIVREKIYLESGQGTLYCFHKSDGAVLWSKDLFKDFD